MLIVFDSSQNRVLSFGTYKTLHNHIQDIERVQGKGRWIFARHSWARMMSCYRYLHARQCSSSLEESFEQTLEKALKKAREGTDRHKSDTVLEIINGNPKEAAFIPITPDVDVDDLLQKWCQAYCKARKYRLFDVSCPDDVREMGRTG